MADANVQTTTLSNFLNLETMSEKLCVRVGGPNVTADLNLKNELKFMPVLGLSYFPLIKQYSRF